MAATPTASEFGEENDYWFEFAWELYLRAHTHTISRRKYIEWATHLDTIPGVSEYFRWLLHFDMEAFSIPVENLNAFATLHHNETFCSRHRRDFEDRRRRRRR